MLRSRCRRTAAVVLALALAVAPLASAAPVAPSAGSWWSALGAGLDGLFGLLGLGGTRTIEAPEGPGLEPDGEKPQADSGPVAPDSPDSLLQIGDDEDGVGSAIDPTG